MTTYDLWYADTDPDGGDFEIMAISQALGHIDPAEYFLPRFNKPAHYGLISIEGDEHLCADYFSVK